jgi:RND family efflux transporter MFP subunit
VGEALPFRSATLYSKVSGYLAKIAVDVGDRVVTGQFIAEIQSPEIDEQIHTAQVALENKRRLYGRARDLAEQGFYSKQTLDNAETDVRVAESQLSELRTLSGYRVLRAPFAGVVTQRYADPGALVTSAATSQTAALPLVTISETSKLKVTVYVEQAEAPNVKPGLDAEIVDGADPQRKSVGKVSRVSGELDPKTRTLLTEVDFDNSKGQFVAGSFVTASLLFPAVSYIEVPAPALVSRDKKSFVAVVSADNHVQLRPVEIAGTDGKVLRIASGLNEGERVVLSLPATVADGAKVNPMLGPGAPPPAPQPAPGAKGQVSPAPAHKP